MPVLTDVIAALATPPGRSAVALARLSGADAFRVAAAVIPAFQAEPYRTARLARVVEPESGEVLDDVLYICYRAPASYTGEDAVEVTTHGGLLLPAEVLSALLAAGARLAEPGEFTRRAVLNGKMDLLQAEAIGDLVEATAPAQRRTALQQFDRGLTARIGALRDLVLQVEALAAYEIDFPEEDDGPVAPERVIRAATEVRSAVQALLGTAVEGGRLREGALAVIAGRPNVGKSSLFNALLGAERAIVTEIPGTTRDAIESPATCGGFPFRLVDTAGLRATEDRVERLGVEVSRRYLDAADVVITCIESGAVPTAEETAFLETLRPPFVIARTKADLAPQTAARSIRDDEVVVSALTGQGLPTLRSRLAALAFAGLVRGDSALPVLTRERHRSALRRAERELSDFLEARRVGIEAVVAAVHLRAAAMALEGMIGAVTPDHVLDRVFATFCVGK
jgi:tRNA modification GTPase